MRGAMNGARSSIRATCDRARPLPPSFSMKVPNTFSMVADVEPEGPILTIIEIGWSVDVEKGRNNRERGWEDAGSRQSAARRSTSWSAGSNSVRLVLPAVRCTGNVGHHDVAELVFRPANGATAGTPAR